MSSKSKGTNAERELIHLFWSAGWAAVRVAGSGLSKHPNPDIVAGSRSANRKLAIECKVTGDEKKYLTPADIKQLSDFSAIFGCEPWIAVKLARGGSWHFLTLEDIAATENGYVISSELAKMKGLLFNEIIA